MLISAASDGTPANDYSQAPTTSTDGTRIAFASTATNLDDRHTDASFAIYVKTPADGGLTLVSTSTAGVAANGPSTDPSISGDGSAVAFLSEATDLDLTDRDAAPDVYVKDLTTGKLTLASSPFGGLLSDGDCASPSLDYHASVVVFVCATGDLTNPAATSQVFAKDLRTGVLNLLSTAISGRPANGASRQPQLSADGSTVAFTSTATDLDAADLDPNSDVYVKNLLSGKLRLVSATAEGLKSNRASLEPSISMAGTTVAFTSFATNLDPSDTEDSPDFGDSVYVKDLASGALVLASGPAGHDPSISPDGATVTFTSGSPLDRADNNGAADVYRTVLASRTPQWLSAALTSTNPGTASAQAPSAASGGRVAIEEVVAGTPPRPGYLGAYSKDIYLISDGAPATGPASVFGVDALLPPATSTSVPVTPFATGQKFLTLSFGRTQWVKTGVPGSLSSPCTFKPSAITLLQVAQRLDAINPNYFGVGNVVGDYTNDTGLKCARTGSGVTNPDGSFHPAWDQLATLRDTYGWQFVSAGRTYTPMANANQNNPAFDPSTRLTKTQAQTESCGSLSAFDTRGFLGSWGLYAYPGNTWDVPYPDGTTVQDIVNQCFSYGRTYGDAINYRDSTGPHAWTGFSLRPPWYQRTRSIDGGPNPSNSGATQNVYTVPASIVDLITNLAAAPDQWLNLQAYRFYEAGTSSVGVWNCSGPPETHFTPATEDYCWNDYLTIVNSIAGKGISITAPYVVGNNWGRPRP